MLIAGGVQIAHRLNWSTDLLFESPLPQTHGKSHFIRQAPCGFTLRPNSGLDTNDSGSHWMVRLSSRVWVHPVACFI